MAVEIKKIKRPIGGRQFGSSTVAEQSPLRPSYVEKKPPCMDSCPNSEKIREYLQYIAQSDAYGRNMDESIKEGFYILTDTNPLPAVTGRVCPHPCETSCNRVAKDKSVAINSVEMFIGDFGIEKNLPLKKLTGEKRKERIAVIGGGPAGLSCAYQLARRGYAVTIFEKLEKAGGMLRYGIPRFRLPGEVLDAEINRIKDMGVEFKFNSAVGKDGLALKVLKKEFDAVFVGIGSHNNVPLGINESGISNVFSGIEFLRRVNSGEMPDLGSHVVVVGGGDSAMDCARTARRLPTTEKVTVAYRRGKEQMPANPEEVSAAIEEGINFEFMAAPLSIGEKKDGVLPVAFQRTKLGEKDASGRAQFMIAEDEQPFTVDCTSLVASLGQKPDLSGFEDICKNLKKGCLNVDDKCLISEEDNVFAGGDVVGFWLLTQAIGSGNAAAFSIHEKFSGEPAPVDKRQVIGYKDMHLEFYNESARQERRNRQIISVKGDFQPVVYGLSRDEAVSEAKRCMSCGLCYDCGNCFMYCSKGCVKMLEKGKHYEFHLETCNGCMKCFESCPCGYISNS